MNEHEAGRQEGQRCWAGLDWGGEEHAVCVVRDNKEVVTEFRSGTSLVELEGLVARLHRFGAIGGVAIEATRNPVVGCLVSAGFTVYLINPKLSKNWRQCNSVAGVKNDERDGRVLALELAGRHASLRPFQREDPHVAELAGLCEKVRELIDERTALLQRLKATLTQYYPGALGFFRDWSSPVAWRFLKQFPRPNALAHAHKETLTRFLKANRIGLRPLWLARIEARGEVTRWPQRADSLALEAMALATVAQLQALQPHIDKLDRLIAQSVRHLPHAHLVQSLPGAGKRLAPALAAITAGLASGQEKLEAVRCVSGVAPVEDKSGKRRRIGIRRRCNKHWRDILHLFAYCSTACCAWARAFYDLHREHGDPHASALRKLADKWFKILKRMFETGQPYDDDHYVRSLRRRGSPVYLRLRAKTCG